MYPLYTTYAKYYDIIYKAYLERGVPRIIDFVEEVFRRDAEIEVRSVLDIACGTGGPTIELARRGYRVVGLDISEEMIRIAREKARRSGASAEFIVGDMREINFVEEFDAVTCFFTSINYILEDEGMERLFLGVHRCLRRGGVFLFDIPNPYRMEKWLKGIPTIWRVDDGDISVLVIDATIMETVSGLVNWKRTLLVKNKNGIEFVSDYHRLRVYTPNELRVYARLSGFRRTRIYGDLRITDSPPKDATRLFFVAVK